MENVNYPMPNLSVSHVSNQKTKFFWGNHSCHGATWHGMSVTIQNKLLDLDWRIKIERIWKKKKLDRCAMCECRVNKWKFVGVVMHSRMWMHIMCTQISMYADKNMIRSDSRRDCLHAVITPYYFGHSTAWNVKKLI